MKKIKVPFALGSGVIFHLNQQRWEELEKETGYSFAPDLREDMEAITEIYQVLHTQELTAISVPNFSLLATVIKHSSNTLLEFLPEKRGPKEAVKLRKYLVKSIRYLEKLESITARDPVREGFAWTFWVAALSQRMLHAKLRVGVRKDSDKTPKFEDSQFAKLVRALDIQASEKWPQVIPRPPQPTVANLAQRINHARKEHPPSFGMNELIKYWDAKGGLVKRFLAYHPVRDDSHSN